MLVRLVQSANISKAVSSRLANVPCGIEIVVSLAFSKQNASAVTTFSKVQLPKLIEVQFGIHPKRAVVACLNRQLSLRSSVFILSTFDKPT